MLAVCNSSSSQLKQEDFMPRFGKRHMDELSSHGWALALQWSGARVFCGVDGVVQARGDASPGMIVASHRQSGR
jgi:hypothetical protein